TDPRMAEEVFAVEFEAMRFFRVTGGGIAAKGDINVVVELAVIKDRDAAASGLRVSTGLAGVRARLQDIWLGKQMNDGDGARDVIRINDRAKVLSGPIRTGVERPTRGAASHIRRGNIIAHHLAGGGGAGGNCRAENPVVRRPITMRS